jgi:hypothetical protein
MIGHVVVYLNILSPFVISFFRFVYGWGIRKPLKLVTLMLNAINIARDLNAEWVELL